MTDRFHHLHIETGRFDDALKFYRDVLGWSVESEQKERGSGRSATLSGGGIKLVLAEGNSGKLKLHLDIHDVEARFKELPKGTHVVAEPQDNRDGRRSFVVRDPDGNLIAFEELHHRSY